MIHPAGMLLGVALLGGCDSTTTVRFFQGSSSSAGGGGTEGEAGASGSLGSGGEGTAGVSGWGGDLGAGGSRSGGGASDGEGGSVPLDVPVPAQLRHHYDFSGIGTTLVDLVGDAPGVIHNGAELAGDGTLTLDGEDDYVALPGGLLRELGSVSLVVWFTWNGLTAWERVFDFGKTVEGPGLSGTALGTLFFTPRYLPGPGSSAHFEISVDGTATATRAIAVNSEAAFPAGLMHQIVVVFDGATGTLSSFIDGALQSSASWSFGLSDLDDENAWLGQSMWAQDAHMAGTYDDFRLYHGVLSLEEIQAMLSAGLDGP